MGELRRGQLPLKRLCVPICVLLVVCLGFWLRLADITQTIVDQPIQADAQQYVHYAVNLLLHGVYSSVDPNSGSAPVPDSFRSPGYPLLIAFNGLLGGPDRFYAYTLYSQVILGTLAIFLLYVLARQWLATCCRVGMRTAGRPESACHILYELSAFRDAVQFSAAGGLVRLFSGNPQKIHALAGRVWCALGLRLSDQRGLSFLFRLSWRDFFSGGNGTAFANCVPG